MVAVWRCAAAVTGRLEIAEKEARKSKGNAGEMCVYLYKHLSLSDLRLI